VSTIKVDTVQSSGGGAVTLTQQQALKIWFNYDAQDQATKGSLNQSSLTDNATGDFTSSHTNNLGSAENKCVMGTVWNTQNEGSSEFGGAERGFNGIHQAGDTGSATSTIRINSRLAAQSAANGADTDFDGTYCAIVGDLA